MPIQPGKTGTRLNMPHSRNSRDTNASLNEAAVRGIRLRAAQGVSPRELSNAYNVGVETIRRVIRWETWRWVGELETAEGQPVPLEQVALPKDFDAAASLARVRARAGLEELPQGAGLEKLNKMTADAAAAEAKLFEGLAPPKTE